MKLINIFIDEMLVRQGMALTGLKTCSELVEKALYDLMRRANQRNLKLLKGNVQWIGNLGEMGGA